MPIDIKRQSMAYILSNYQCLRIEIDLMMKNGLISYQFHSNLIQYHSFE